MPFSITEFQALINKNGLAQTNRFDVLITPPRILSTGQGGESISQVISAYCDSATIPGIGLQVNNIPRYGIGPTIKKPIHVNFGDWSANFVSDINGNLYKFFHKWIKSIYNFSNNGNSRGTDSNTNLGSYEISYKGDYTTDIIISTYDTSNKPFLKIKLFEAFPYYVQDAQIARGSIDELLKFNVTFTYREWSTENLTSTIPVETTNPITTNFT